MAVTTPPTIDPAPTAPQRGDRTTFSGRLDAFITWLVTAVSQFGAVASNVANNASDAASSASAAATSAGTATTAAGAAATKAGDADTARAAAQAAQAAAEAAYDNFDDRYLGAKAANPTTDNDGNALLTGALYFNTTAGEMRVWSGAVWKTAYIPADGYATTSDLATKLDKAGGTLTGGVNEFKGSDIASAATTMNIWAAAQGNVMTVTGTTATSGLPAAPQAGATRTLIAAGAWPLTHGANFILPGSTNYTCAAGDLIEVTAVTTTQFRLKIFKADGSPVVSTGSPVPTIVVISSTQTWTAPVGVTKAKVTVVGGGGGGCTASNGASGAAGGAAIKTYTNIVPNTGYAVTVGAGGAAGSPGVTGGTSSFAGPSVTISATGGTGGTSNNIGGTGGTGSNGDLNIGGGGGGITATWAATGGNSIFGGGGRGSDQGAQTAKGFGGGGGTGSAGAPGVVIIEY